ncbi:hypothetical protein D3C73_1506940 [compost metagenome]
MLWQPSCSLLHYHLQQTNGSCQIPAPRHYAQSILAPHRFLLWLLDILLPVKDYTLEKRHKPLLQLPVHELIDHVYARYQIPILPHEYIE